MILLIGTGIAIDVPFVLDEKSSDVSSYAADKIEKISTSSLDLAGVPFTSIPSGMIPLNSQLQEAETLRLA